MKLFEFEGKNILRKYGIATPKGNVASSSIEAELVAKEIGKPVMLKSQALVSGRGKSGGIVSAGNHTEAMKVASNLIGNKVKGAVVESVLVEERIDIV
jgi:succinyl-CoA synthetase beta subunit